MCAKLLACPLCSQPGFLTLDALRAGLISVATRPLMCPVCNEVLFGIDKLTIHLFSHTLNLNNNVLEQPKQLKAVVQNDSELVLSYNLQENTCQEGYKIAECNNMIAHDEATKSQHPKEKASNHSTVDLEICLEQSMIPKNVPQVVFVADQGYDGRRNMLQEYYNSGKIILEPCKTSEEPVKESLSVNRDSQYSSNNVKDTESLELQSKVDRDRVSSVKKWIQSQQLEEPNFSGNLVHIDSDRQTIRAGTAASSSNIMTKECKLTNCELMTNSTATSLHNELESFSNEETVNDRQRSNEHQEAQENEQGTGQQEPKPCESLVAKDKIERCNICGFQFTDYNILLLHKQLVHMISDKDLDSIPEDLFRNYSCHLCSKVFKMRGSLMVHMRVAHTGYSLGSLAKTGHGELPNNEKGFSCPTCGKKFKKEQHVVQHLKTHEGKQWECDVCNKMFTTKYFLKKHKRLHSGEMPYKCNICEKTFTFQQSYHKHRLYHKDDKPHTCTTCGRSFKELSTLHNHERIHTGEKPFACETCGKCFRQRVSYLVHRRIHTGVMPYKCTACGKSFRYKVSQRTHKCPMQQATNAQQATDANLNLDSVAPTTESTTPQETMVPSTMVNDMDSEKNKYVLIINPQGQHLLARETEIETTQVNKAVTMGDDLMLMALSDKPAQTTWSSNIPVNTVFTEVQETPNKIATTSKKPDKVGTDFYTMPLVPLENGLSTPTNEMKQLHVSSPLQENNMKPYESFKQDPNDVELVINNSGLHENYETSDDHNSLQTINEESLKELLYGIHNK